MANYNYSPFLKQPSGVSIDHIDIDSRFILDPLDKIVQFQKKSLIDIPLPKDITLMTLRIASFDEQLITLYCLIPKNWINNRILFHCHGGGFLLPMHAACLSMGCTFARLCQTMVILPDYRTAIHHPYPISLNDCYCGYTYCDVFFDLSNSIISGDSAGGCLAISLNRKLNDTGLLKSNANLLLYPVTDNNQDYESIQAYKRAEVWNANCNKAMWSIYCDNTQTDAYTIPMNIIDFTHFKDTYIEVCEMDILKDQGLAFANKLKCNGINTITQCIPGAYHAYDSDIDNPFVKTIYYNRAQWLLKYFN